MTIVTIYGTSGNDTLTAASGDVSGAQYYIDGQDGSDNITTGGGNDTVYAGNNAGNDTITLGSGNDSVIGSSGSHDIANAGTGKSIIDFQASNHVLFNGNTVAGSSGADSVYAYGDTIGHDTFIAGINSDTIIGSQAGNDSVVIGNNYHGNYYIDASGHIVDGGTGDDVIVVGAGFAGVSNSTVSGGSFHDQIVTYGHTNNIINTNAGDDTVQTLAANDSITLGGGINLVFAGTGGDETINGATGDLSQVTYAADPHGVHLALSGASATVTDSGGTSDSITNITNFGLSGAGGNTVSGSLVNGDQIYAGGGNNIFDIAHSGSGSDILEGGLGGNNTADYSGFTSPVIFTLNAANLTAITVTNTVSNATWTDHLNDFQNLNLPSNSTITGSSDGDHLFNLGNTSKIYFQFGANYDNTHPDTIISGTSGVDMIDPSNMTGTGPISIYLPDGAQNGSITQGANTMVLEGNNFSTANTGVTSIPIALHLGNVPTGQTYNLISLQGSGNNTIYDSSHSDFIVDNGSGNDQIYLTRGNDGSGFDIVQLNGHGQDTIVVGPSAHGGEGDYIYYFTQGVDKIDFQGFSGLTFAQLKITPEVFSNYTAYWISAPTAQQIGMALSHAPTASDFIFT